MLAAAPITLAIAISEELWFRGLLQSNLTRVFPSWAAILIQAFPYSLSHLVSIGKLPLASVALLGVSLFAYGLLMGYVYKKTGNMAYPVLIHWISDIAMYAIKLEFLPFFF